MKEMNEVEFMLRIYVMVFYASQRLLNEIRITFHFVQASFILLSRYFMY